MTFNKAERVPEKWPILFIDLSRARLAWALGEGDALGPTTDKKFDSARWTVNPKTSPSGPKAWFLIKDKTCGRF